MGVTLGPFHAMSPREMLAPLLARRWVNTHIIPKFLKFETDVRFV